MRTFIDSVDSLPLLVKVLLAIPALDIIWGIYRIVCALDEKDVIALVVALLVGMHYKNELKTVRFKAEANSYVVPGSMNITVSNDHFIRSHVTRTAIPKSNDNDLGSSGGGSSTHSSSSGSSHGGSSGSF